MHGQDPLERCVLRWLSAGQGALRFARTLLVVVPSLTLGAGAHYLAGGCITVIGLVLTGCVLGASRWTQLSASDPAVPVVLADLRQLLAHGLLEIGCRGPAHRAAATAVRCSHCTQPRSS